LRVAAGVTSDRPGRRPLGRPYWALWAANTCSGLGDGLVAVALPLLATTLTRRPELIAAVLVAQKAPWLVVGLPAGAHADRVDRARLMRRMDVMRGGILAATTVIVATGHMTLALVYLLAVITGTCEPFFSAANQATLPAVVPVDLLARGNGLLEIGQNATEQTVGPALAGVAYSLARAVPFAVDALSFAGSAAFLLGLGRPPPPTPRAGPERRLWTDTRAGLTWYRRSRPLVVITATVAFLAFTQALASATLVLFALRRLHLSGLGYGVFVGVAAAGNVLGGLLAAPLLRRLATGPVVIGAIVVSATGYATTALTSSAVFAALLLGIEATAVVVGSVATISFRQRATPALMQARVANVWRTAVWGAIPLGAVAGGAIASVAGLRAPFFVAAILQLGLAAIVVLPLLRLLPPDVVGATPG
jgi:MFS family permease